MWYASVIFFHFFQSSIKYRFEFRQIATFTYEILWQSSVPSHRGKSPEKFHDTRRDRRNRTNTITCPKSCWIFGKYKKYLVTDRVLEIGFFTGKLGMLNKKWEIWNFSFFFCQMIVSKFDRGEYFQLFANNHWGIVLKFWLIFGKIFLEKHKCLVKKS